MTAGTSETCFVESFPSVVFIDAESTGVTVTDIGAVTGSVLLLRIDDDDDECDPPSTSIVDWTGAVRKALRNYHVRSKNYK